MKRGIMAAMAVLLVAAALATSLTIGSRQEVYAEEDKEMRAVWISTVYSADFPSSRDAEAQKQEFVKKLDQLQALGINTVMVQVRPKADAFYKSSINPWSNILTGVQGQDPGYDPMAFMIEECHKRGMEFHAWLNPYRITVSTTLTDTALTGTGTNLSDLADGHPAKANPDWVITYNDALYYNPDLAAVKEHIRDTAVEIARDYDVDGIHFDDYFYPSGYPLTDGQGKDGAEANQRREHVNEMVRMVYDGIKAVKPQVQFGISPMGIWKNRATDSAGSATNGNEGYYSVSADATAWIKAGTVDYIVPQIYWKIGHDKADYETLVSWWASQASGTKVKVYIGQGVYTDAVAQEIDAQLAVNDKYAAVKGSVYFSARDLLDSRQGCAEKIKTYYEAKDGGAAENPGSSQNNSNGQSDGGQPAEPAPETPQAAQTTALYTRAAVLVNGQSTAFEAYNIGGYNYFKLRDVAAAINGTEKQFDAVYDEATKGINIVKDTAYTVAGGELAAGDGTDKTALAGNAVLLVEGQPSQAQPYNIGGYNYYKLRDLGQALNFHIGWDDGTATITIDTSRDYTE